MTTLDDLRRQAKRLSDRAVAASAEAEMLEIAANDLVDALNVYNPEPPVPPVDPTFTPVRYARFNYVVDNVNSIDTQVSRWPVQVLQGDEWHKPQLAALKGREGVLTLRYADPVIRRGGDPNGWTQCLPPSQIKDSWMLRERSGNIIRRDRDGDQFVDPGNVEYRTAAAAFLVDVCRREGWDGILLDEVNYNPTWSFGSWPAKYTNSDLYATAMRWCVQTVSAALRAAGKKCFVNLAGNYGDPWTNIFTEPALFSGHCIEFYVARGDKPVATLENGEWKKLLDWTVARERAGQFGMYHAMTTDPKLAVYALGTFLLATEGHGVFMASQDPYGLADVWVPQFEAARRLGKPKGAYTIAGDTYHREFENGSVDVVPRQFSSAFGAGILLR